MSEIGRMQLNFLQITSCVSLSGHAKKSTMQAWHILQAGEASSSLELSATRLFEDECHFSILISVKSLDVAKLCSLLSWRVTLIRLISSR